MELRLDLFHYHLVTSKVRVLEGRYLGKLGFELVGRYGWRGESSQWFEPGTSWDELDAIGFRLRLVELARGAVNERAAELGLKIQDHPGKRTFVTTEAGYRLEVHPPREWIEDALGQADEM